VLSSFTNVIKWFGSAMKSVILLTISANFLPSSSEFNSIGDSFCKLPQAPVLSFTNRFDAV